MWIPLLWSPASQRLSCGKNNVIVKKIIKMHNSITHSRFTVAAAAELWGKNCLVAWTSDLQQCVQDVWALESICWCSELNLELCKSGFGFSFMRFTFDLALNGDLDACLVQICEQCTFCSSVQYWNGIVFMRNTLPTSYQFRPGCLFTATSPLFYEIRF